MGHKEDLDRYEATIERLKFEYDQYFLGFSKRPPDNLRQEAEKMTRQFIGFSSPNTALKFRAQTLVQRMATHRQLWDRILQQIEDGTYKRDIYRASLKERQKQPPQPNAPSDVIEDAELVEEPTPPPRKWGGVYEQYLAARGQTREGTTGISYEKLHEVLEKQAAQIREKYKARDVEFKVVIENGKAKLKATPLR